MKMKRIAKISIVFFLMISICFSMIAHGDTTYEEKNVIIKPKDYRSDMLWLTSTDRETQFNITSDHPVNVYIITSDTYSNIGWSYPHDEGDFTPNVVEKKNITDTRFTWIKPDDQSYYLVIFNPNDENATISFSYTESLIEEIGESVGGIFGTICAGTLCIVFLVIYILISAMIGIWMLKDADRRGKNPVVWFIIGLILGIIGLIIWYLIRPKTFKEETKKKDTDRICPNCGRVIPLDAMVCPYCGKDFRPPKT